MNTAAVLRLIIYAICIAWVFAFAIAAIVAVFLSSQASQEKRMNNSPLFDTPPVEADDIARTAKGDL